jgi:hypothetical protein
VFNIKSARSSLLALEFIGLEGFKSKLKSLFILT